MCLDDDVQRVTPGAVRAMGWAAEMFIEVHTTITAACVPDCLPTVLLCTRPERMQRCSACSCLKAAAECPKFRQRKG